MDSSEEKFFETLAHGGSRNLEVPEADLAKANSALTRPPKVIAQRDEEDFGAEPEGQLTIDVYQTPNEIVVESAIAGVRPDDIDVNVSSDSIAIKGERRREHHIKEDDYFYQECYWGRFARSVILPQEIDPESANVTLKNGILTVRLPKLSRVRSRKLKVKVE